MATRGYFVIPDDPCNPSAYSWSGDALVEACHDGYTNRMLADVFSVHRVVAYAHTQGVGKSVLFQPPTVEDSYYFGASLEDCIYRLFNSCVIDLTHHGIIQLLGISNLGKYAHIPVGVTRYSRPVELTDAAFTLACANARQQRYVLELKEDDEEIDLADYVAAFNDGVICKGYQAKLLPDGRVLLPILGAMYSLLYNQYVHGVPVVK